MEFKTTINEIIENIGGESNVINVTHCMTRLRFNLKNKDIVNMENIRSIKGILGVTYSMGQLQIIMGKNVIPAFNELNNSYNFEIASIVDENESITEQKSKTWKSFGSKIIDILGASISPIIPGLIAGGMLKVAMLLASLAFPSITETQTYTLLTFIADVPFYFLPIFVAYGASRKLGGTPIYAMIVAAGLLSPGFIELVSTGEQISFLGLPVLAVNYYNTLIPALLSTILVTYLEKLFDKIIPGIFKAIFVGMLTISIGIFFSLVVLGPLGTYIGNYVVSLLEMLNSTVGPVAVGVLTAILPFMIMTGTHSLLAPVLIQSLTNPGYDAFIRPALVLHNIAESGACLGVALKTKNKDFRAEALSIGVGCILAGVTEPAVYGIVLRLRKPLYGVMAGGLIGGTVAGLMGAKAFEMGYSSILAIPIFKDTVLAIITGVAVTLVVSTIVTYIIGFEDITE